MKTYNEELREFIEIYDYMEEMEESLLYKSNMSRDEAYERLYNKAFSDEINGRLQQIFPFDYCTIDGGYDDDYIDWKQGLNEAVENIREILNR